MSTASSIFSENKKVFGQREISKVEACNWKIVDRPGFFMSIRKRDLHVDPEYQRTNVSNARVLEIASSWSWLACGCLLVAQRADGSYWVYDGQHRKLAADKRSDIQELPCLVFNVEGKTEEAAGFVRSNTVRGAMSAFNKYRAQLVAGDETAKAVKEMVEAFGYTIAAHGETFIVSCVAALMKQYVTRPDVARRVFGLCAELSQGKPIPADVFQSLCLLEIFLIRQALPSLTDATYAHRFQELGLDGIAEAIHRSCFYHEKGGAKIGAEGIRNALNKFRRSRRIPSLMNTEEDTEV